MNLPSDYIIAKIMQYTKRPMHMRHRNAYNFECPICNEGKSSGKKRRGFYNADEGYIYCHNCNRGWDPIKWIQEVCGLTFTDLMKEAQSYDFTTMDSSISARFDTPVKRVDFGTLPEDSINLLDDIQRNYYIQESVVRQCWDLIQARRLHTAINRPKSFWVSLKDKIHKNRLCIPFYDEDNQIRFYQTRTVLAEDMVDRPKYLSKINADKRVYGINNINRDLDYLFIFEGPIDSMFVENGLGICGLHLTDLQDEILRKYSLYRRIWVPDNQYIDEPAKEKTMELLDEGARVFIWPKELRGFKDLNDVCCKYKLDQISPKLLVDNSFVGLEAKTKLLIS